MMIRTDALTKRYGGVPAVDGVTVTVPGGSVVGLLGPNGAGKTTLLRLLLGLARPTSGGGSVQGRDLVTDSGEIRRRVALVPETKSLYRGVSGGEFLRFYASFFPEADLQGAISLLDRWNVDLSLRDDALSHGSRAKVLLAAALTRGAELLLLDEPTEGLDPGAIEDLWTTLLRRVGGPDGTGVILSTHRLDEVERVCDRVMVLDRGRIVLEGEIDELRARWRRMLIRTRPGDPGIAAIPGVVAVRDRCGVVEVTTAAWDGSLRARLADNMEILVVREMDMREVYLAVVGHER